MDLDVSRFECLYRVPRRLERSGLRDRLDHVARRLLTDAWDRLGSRPGDDGRVYCIERLDLDLSLPAAADDGALARAWAEQVEHGIAAAIRQGTARTFENRAAVLAAYVDDLLHGRGAAAWYFGEPRGIEGLTTADAVVAALTADPDIGREALLQLPHLEALLGALSDEQVERVANRCLLPDSPEVLSPGALPDWVAAVGAALSCAPAGDGARRFFRGYAGALRRHPQLGPDVNFARFIRAVIGAAEALAARDDGGARLRAVERGEWEALREVVPALSERRLLAAAVQQAGGSAVARMLRQATSPAASAPAVPTAFGGLFLLAPGARDLRLPDPMPPLFMYAVALECLGAENRQRAPRDAGVRLFAGLGVPVGEADLQALAADEVERTARTLLRRFADRLGAFAGSTDAYLRRNFLQSEALVETAANRVTVRFVRCSLQVVLRMAGFDGPEWPVPWLEGQSLELRFE